MILLTKAAGVSAALDMPQRLGIGAGLLHRQYCEPFSSSWHSSTPVALVLWIPTGVAPLWVRGSLDCATMKARTQQVPSLLFIRSALCLGWRLDMFSPVVAMPLAGLSNSLVSAQQRLSIHTEPFAGSESEFGFTGGLELSFTHQRFMVSMPVVYERTFSLPQPLDSWSAGMMAGWMW